MKKRIIKPFDIEKAKAGAEVCTRDGSEARIICFDRKTERDYTILALITNGSGEEDILYYRADGKRIEKYDSLIDLVLVEYEEEEQHQFKPFDKVLVRCDDDDVWMCDLFSHCSNTINLPFVCVGDRWGQCIPFEGNEYLLGTTNNPE